MSLRPCRRWVSSVREGPLSPSRTWSHHTCDDGDDDDDGGVEVLGGPGGGDGVFDWDVEEVGWSPLAGAEAGLLHLVINSVGSDVTTRGHIPSSGTTRDQPGFPSLISSSA